MKRVFAAVCLTVLGVSALPHVAAADERWFEIKSPHFTVWSNAPDGNTRTLVWQLEQIRSAIAVVWPWAKVEMAKPLMVVAVKDEAGIKALAPEYWEQKRGVRPVSVWVSGADQHYMVIRADIRGDDNATLNPHTSAYFTYVNLILQASFDRDLPLWFARGLAGVLSNTLVRNDHIAIGAPIPWHIEEMRARRPFPLTRLVALTRESPEYTQGDGLGKIDAQSWAFVHYLMFGAKGAHQARVNRLASLLASGRPAGEAVAEALGRIEDFERPFADYVERYIFSYQKALVDASVKRERFAARPIPPAEAAAGRAAFHVAMRRPAEARSLLDAARQANPSEPGVFIAEALQADMDGRRDDAKAAYLKGVELGSSNAYAHYRAAVLHWPRPDAAALPLMEKHLARAVELSPAFAPAYANLAEVRAWLKRPTAEIMPLLATAVKLEPRNPWHRLAGARVLWRLGSPEEARKTAETALTLADSDAARSEAQQLLAAIGK